MASKIRHEVVRELILGEPVWVLRSVLPLTESTQLVTRSQIADADCTITPVIPSTPMKRRHERELRAERDRRARNDKHVLESDLRKTVIAYLDRAGIYWWPMPIGPMIVGQGRQVKSPLKGFPDLAGIVPGANGRLFVIELKRPVGGRVEKDQRDWHKELRDQKVLVIVARCLDDVTSQLKGPYAV